MTVLVKDWGWKLYLGIGHTNIIKSLVLAAKYFFDVFLGELGHQGFLVLLVAD